MRLLKAAMLGLSVLTAAGAAQAAGTLRIGLQDDPDRLDPALGGTFAGRIVFASLCDKLVDLTAKLDFAPQLATAWSWSADGRALTMTLRQGVTFHDGEPMTAEAVRDNLERYRSAPESVRKAELKAVSAIEVVDAQTVRLVLSQPFAPLIAVLSDRAGMMVSPKAVARLGKDFFTAPVCSGPFRFTERVAQDRIVLDRFPGYWNAGAIHLDRVVFRPIADTTVRLVNLQAGQLDMLEELAPSDAGKVKADAKLRLAAVTGLGYAAINFNVGHGPRADTPIGRDPRIRAALEAAIDRDVINKVVMDGLFVPDNQTELPDSRYFNPKVPVPPRDLARAKALLKEAGVEHPSFEFKVANTPRDVQVVEVIQAMAAEAGFDIKVSAGEVNANIEAMNRGDYQAHLNTWSGRSDPDFNISIFIACDGFQNWGKYCNPKLQEVLERGRAVTDPAQRQALYHQAVEIYAQDRAILYLYHPTWLFAHSAALQGFVTVPDGIIRPQGLRLE
ncbi:ABC transporter substrate-binding protein [Limobrevibacterium gyesilva]|uniref:ABC transporter substrate-binding protein n=1 Tax=Limobrevibacterium gyesilva TaxID=2991712 RepID=A0AA42CEQ4_9PROT|nr:ABC transporter substrate-binding protein [Limobrevibacterium gyesilva]MCW3475579.1 ABC transporter substrate-binding protein [Limobrevibacterium gyesilva]